MKDNFIQLLRRIYHRQVTTMKLPLLVYFACLPLFFSASAMSWPFPDVLQSAPQQSRDWQGRDCGVTAIANDSRDAQEPAEEEEPECD